jgi:hypothetical protein
MRGWFRAKYIERSEHQRVVAQYARLVGELRENLELLQTRTYELQYILSQRKMHKLDPVAEQPPVSQEVNVVRVDFQKRGH